MGGCLFTVALWVTWSGAAIAGVWWIHEGHLALGIGSLVLAVVAFLAAGVGAVLADGGR